MSSLSKAKNEFDIVELEEKELFSINKSNEKIKVYTKEILENIVSKTFNKKYKNLLCLVMDINESDDSTESDAELAFLKIESLKKYIINNYGKYLTKEKLNKYLKMLLILESKINISKNRGKSR